MKKHTSIFPLLLLLILLALPGNFTVFAQTVRPPGEQKNRAAAYDARLDSVLVTGIERIPRADIDRIILSRPGGILNDGLIEHDRAALADYLHEQGWWSASVASSVDSTKAERTLLIFRIEAGAPVLFGTIILTVPEGIRSVVKEPPQDLYGKPFTRRALDSLAQAIVIGLADNGFPGASVGPKLTAHGDTIDVVLQVQPGAKAHVDSIVIQGLTVTKDVTVRRELVRFRGRDISPEMVSEVRSAVGRMRFLRLSSDPSIEYTDAGKGLLLVNMEEGSQGTFDGVIGYQPAGGGGSGELVGKVDLGLANLFGSGRSARVRWENLGNKSSDLELRYEEPWAFGFPVNASGVFSQEDRQAQGYTRTLFSAGIGHTLGRLQANAGFRYEKVSSDSTRSYGATGIEAGISWNAVDNPANPRSGARYAAAWSTVVKNYRFGGGARTSLTRTELGLDNYIPTALHQSVAILLSYRDVTAGNGLLDPSDRWWLGGASTLRGYRERIFPAVRALISTVEYRFLTGETSRVFVFVDTGYLQDRVQSGGGIVTRSLTRTGYGFGLRLQSRAGMLGFDYGLGRGDSPGEGKLHVRLSTEF
ncbi:MAG: BamA/TamA family outer membrane protein [Candidatus Latescibacter sp.]|nr:BamA/TamA family outer membrane protein [Candidatus Latescibacter sp.]